MNKWLQKLQRPVRFDYLEKQLSGAAITILDIGCGNHSSTITKKYFPQCRYYGLDVQKNYNNDIEDYLLMEKFYHTDLSASDLKEIPQEYFDCIIFSHVIEHLPNGLDVLQKLLTKLKKGGIIYIETPSPRSLKFPSMRGSLNFWDDNTHVKVYPIGEITSTITQNDCVILRAGLRRSTKRIILLPMGIVYSLFRYKYLSGTVFWDILGFANIVIGKRLTI